MAFNLTGIDVGLFFTVNTAINIGFFLLFVLLPLVLCVVCVVALISAGSMDLKLRILLANVFAAEICTWLFWTGSFLGYPFLFYDMSHGDTVCSLFTSMAIAGDALKFTASALYSLNIFLFVKHGVKKVKWHALVPCITVSWIVAIVLGNLSCLPQSGVMNEIGICSIDVSNIIFRTTIIPIALTVDVVCMGVTLIFSVFTYKYVKHNTLGDNAELMKSVTKLLVYFCVVAGLSLISDVLPAATHAIRDAAAASGGIVGIFAMEHILNIIYIAPSFATPLVAIFLLKPIRDALKATAKKIFCVQQSDESGGSDGNGRSTGDGQSNRGGQGGQGDRMIVIDIGV